MLTNEMIHWAVEVWKEASCPPKNERFDSKEMYWKIFQSKYVSGAFAVSFREGHKKQDKTSVGVTVNNMKSTP